MSKVDPAIRKEWVERPNEAVDLILHVEGSASERHDALVERGVEIRRRFRLTRSLSIRCDGKTAIKLLKIPWITKIEADRPVKAFGR